MFSVSMGIIGFSLQKCLLSSYIRFLRLLSKSLNLIGCQGDKKGKIAKKNKIKLIFFSETIREMKLILSIHVYDIRPCINCVIVSFR